MAHSATAASRSRVVVLAGRIGSHIGGFAFFHALNMALSVFVGLLMLLVLSHVLPRVRYGEVVLMTAIGLYFLPFDTALGKAGFSSLRKAIACGLPPVAPSGYRLALAFQVGLGIATTVAVPSFLAPFGSQAWFEDALYMSLCRFFNVWSCHLQPTAWALGCNLAFVRLSTAMRLLQIVSLLAAFVLKSFLFFGVTTAVACIICIGLGLRRFSAEGLFARGDNVAPGESLRDYGRGIVVALMGTGVDVLIYNAPYLLVSTRFGAGATLVVFDSVMKIARVAMAGSRTISEIALPLQTTRFERGLGEGRFLYAATALACTAFSAAPAVLILIDGRAVFRILLGPNDVVPSSAMLPAAALVIVLGSYQAFAFFLGYANRSRPLRQLMMAGLFGIGVCTVVASFPTPSTALILGTIALYLAVMTILAGALTSAMLAAPASSSVRGRPSQSAATPTSGTALL